MTGNRNPPNLDAIYALTTPAKVFGYGRFSLNYCPYPAVIKQKARVRVTGHLLRFETREQRRRVDAFEKHIYTVTSVVAVLDLGEKVEADMYVWTGEPHLVTSEP